MGGECGMHRTKEIYGKFWHGNLKERGNLKDVNLDGTIILKRISKKEDGKTWTGLI